MESIIRFPVAVDQEQARERWEQARADCADPDCLCCNASDKDWHMSDEAFVIDAPLMQRVRERAGSPGGSWIEALQWAQQHAERLGDLRARLAALQAVADPTAEQRMELLRLYRLTREPGQCSS